MNYKVICCFLTFLMINSLYLMCQSKPQKSFWEKYKYSIEIIYLEDKYYQEFLTISKTNRGNKVFADKTFSEILEKCAVKTEENITYGLPPNKSVYRRLVSDTAEDAKICFSGYRIDDRFCFIRLDSDFNENDDTGFVPYICIIRLPPFELPAGVDFFEYLEKNKEIKVYIDEIERFFDRHKEYKFKMDEFGVIWVFYKNR